MRTAILVRGSILKPFIVFSLVLASVAGSYTLISWESDPAMRHPSSAPQVYEGVKGCMKQDILWQKAVESEYQELPEFKKFGAIELFKMNMQAIHTKRDRQADFAPQGWKKYLHRHGSLAKVKIVPRDNTYSGLFQGAECGLLRLSLTYRPGGGKPVAPGLALKILRDGVPSANVSALVSLEGQGADYNFFAHPMSNIVPTSSAFGQKLVHKVFRKVTRYPEELLVSDFAAVDSRGGKVAQVVSPRQLFFVPSRELPKFSSDKHDVREDFAALKEGSVIYEVHAVNDRHANFDYENYKKDTVAEFLKDSTHVADIVLTSEFVSSEFGDDQIFFRHQIR